MVVFWFSPASYQATITCQQRKRNERVHNAPHLSPHSHSDMVSAVQRVSKRLEKAKRQARKDAFYSHSDPDSEDEKPEWIGEPSNKDSLLQRISEDKSQGRGVSDNGSESTPTRRATRKSGLSNIPYYERFRKGKTVYTVGDTVLLRNEQYSRRLEHPYVAQILALWETEEGEFQGDFRWFHQAADIATLSRHHCSGNYPDRLEPGEVVYSLDDDRNNVSTVVAKCDVLSESEWRKRFGDRYDTHGQKNQGRVWFCRGIVHKATGYHSVDWMGNQTMMTLREEKGVASKAPGARLEPTIHLVHTTQTQQTTPANAASPTTRKRARPDQSHPESHSTTDSESEYVSQPRFNSHRLISGI